MERCIEVIFQMLFWLWAKRTRPAIHEKADFFTFAEHRRFRWRLLYYYRLWLHDSGHYFLSDLLWRNEGSINNQVIVFRIGTINAILCDIP